MHTCAWPHGEKILPSWPCSRRRRGPKPHPASTRLESLVPALGGVSSLLASPFLDPLPTSAAQPTCFQRPTYFQKQILNRLHPRKNPLMCLRVQRRVLRQQVSLVCRDQRGARRLFGYGACRVTSDGGARSGEAGVIPIGAYVES